MKARSFLRFSTARMAGTCLLFLYHGGALAATPLYWNPGGTGGDGIWGTSPGEKNWNLVPGAPTGNIAWPDTIDDVAVFQDATGGTVTLSEPFQAAGIIQNGANYSIDAGVITLVPDSAATNPFINVQGGTLSIDSVLAGSNGLIKGGDGTLELSGTNTLSGTTRIENGTLNLVGSLASTSLSISSGASLLNQNGGLSSNAVLANAGSLTLNADETITTYSSDGGALTAGTGTLFTTSAALSNSSSVAGLLNTGTLTSNGAVLLSGIATAGSAAIQSGTLTLSGTLVSDAVSISSGATLLNENGGLSNSATLTNAGLLTLNSNDTITNYISGGGTLTAGTGTLFTTSASLGGGSIVAGLMNTGTLTTGTATISGNVTAGSAAIQSGTLTLSGTLASDTVNISSGAILLNQNGGLSNSATLTNAGSLTLNFNDTITNYISDGGTLTAGTGTLFTTSAALNNGSTVAGLLNTGMLTSDGAVSISGSATVTNTATVQSGTLTLTGTLSTPILNISSGATMIQNGTMGPGSPALATTVVTNEGSFIIQKSAVLKTYTSNGGLLDIQNGRMITQNVFLNDGSITKGGLFSADLLTTNGAVRIENGALGAQAIVASGVLDLVGSIGANDVQIASGASLLNQNGGLGSTANLTIAGLLTLNADDTIANYTSNGGTLTAGPGTLFTTSATLNTGSTIAGLLDTATLTSDGAVLISGTATAGSASVRSGTLTLGGTLASDAVGIASGASLINQNGGLSNSAILTNGGSLTLNVDDTIGTYISNGGILTNDPGTLFTTSAMLNNGSTIAGLLDSDTLTSDGSVFVTGTVAANSIGIDSGTLTNTGTFGNPTTLLNINQGATLAANGIQQYSLLTTSGAGPGTWLGNLENISAVAPGGLGAIGILAIGGNYTQSPVGTLDIDLSGTQSDLLDVSGSATFSGALVLNQLGVPIAPFVPITVVSASSYAGNITSLSENLDGVVLFNPGNGTVIRLEIPAGGDSIFGSTRNQTSTWISLYDDVIDPGITNITSGPGGFEITSGIMDIGNPDLLWALWASFTPAGLDAALLNRLSPEVYGGFSDYAMQATRTHQRSALSAPALEPRDGSGGATGDSAKGGAKAGIADQIAPADWEFFAAVDYFRAGTENSLNQADYDFDGMGVLGGARTRLREHTQLAVYLGADSGSIDGELIDADVLGWTFGVIGEHLIHEKSRTRLTAGISYGSYLFDGTRGSASATAAGWAPGNVNFDDVDVEAFDLFIGIDGVAWQQDALTLVPSAGLRYAMSKMDSFSESTGGPGSPIALEVGRDRHESLLLELGLMAQVEVNPKIALWGEGGVNFGLLDEGRTISASFAKGSRPMRAEADGLEDDSIYLGCGAVYQITEDIRAAIGYRADLRSGAEAQQELRLSSSWRF